MTATVATPLAPDLEAALRRLKLAAVRRLAPEVLLTARTQRWAPDDLLRTLLEAELAARDASNARARLRAAGFPVRKALDVSDRYGFSIDHPADWEERPADHDWTFPADAGWLSPAQEAFVGYAPDTLAPDSGLRVSAWSVAVERGTTVEAWLQAYCPANGAQPCTGIADRTVAAIMDGHAGSRVQFTTDVQAFFLVDDRMYVVAAWLPEYRQVREAYLSTMHLLPGGPAPAATTPPPS